LVHTPVDIAKRLDELAIDVVNIDAPKDQRPPQPPRKPLTVDAGPWHFEERLAGSRN
jgi:hypothetical protein